MSTLRVNSIIPTTASEITFLSDVKMTGAICATTVYVGSTTISSGGTNIQPSNSFIWLQQDSIGVTSTTPTPNISYFNIDLISGNTSYPLIENNIVRIKVNNLDNFEINRNSWWNTLYNSHINSLFTITVAGNYDGPIIKTILNVSKMQQESYGWSMTANTIVGITSVTQFTNYLPLPVGSRDYLSWSLGTSITGGTVSVGSGGTVNVTSGGTVTVGSGGTVNVTSGGTVSVGSGGTVTVSNTGNTILSRDGGTVNLPSGGTVNTSGGTINVSGGTVNVSSSTVNVTSGGTVSITSGVTVSVTSGGTVNISNSGNTVNISSSTINVTSGGTVNVTSGSSVNVTSGGTANHSGGTLNINSGGTVNISSATIQFSNGSYFYSNSLGVATINASTASFYLTGGTSTINATGGTINVSSGGTVNQSGGTINATGGTVNNYNSTLYSSYTALITYTSTTPTAVVLQNTIGLTPIWSSTTRTNDGMPHYIRGTFSSNTLTNNKTVFSVGNGTENQTVTDVGYYFTKGWVSSVSSVTFGNYSFGPLIVGTTPFPVSGFTNVPVEIRVYS